VKEKAGMILIARFGQALHGRRGITSTPRPSVASSHPNKASTGCAAGHPALIYIGISDKLSSRLGGLRRARSRPPRYRGHSAAACVVQHEARGNVVEVSWAQLENVDRRALMGLEVDLIAACRARFGDSPACQFHGRPLE
jgi:hypothetical protein